MAVLLLKDGIIPQPETGVLKAGEYAAVAQGNDIIAQARIRAEEIAAQAARDATDLKRKGYEDGILEGKNEMAEQLFETMAASVEHLSGMESTLIDLVMRSLRTILGSFDRKELVVETVRHALRLVRDEKRIVLRVAVSDAEAVAARLDAITSQYPGMGRVDLVPDASLAPGGCVMETEVGVIDATLQRQLSMIEASFRKQLEERRSR